MATDPRVNQLYEFLGMTAKSGHVNVHVVVSEIARLLGLPEGTIIPTPPPTETL